MTSFEARYRGFCNPCGYDIKPGEFIVNHPEAGYVHEECAEEVGKAIQIDANGREPNGRIRATMPHGKTAADRCDRCFIIHATGQTECY
jgi:hypothetical protein